MRRAGYDRREPTPTPAIRLLFILTFTMSAFVPGRAAAASGHSGPPPITCQRHLAAVEAARHLARLDELARLTESLALDVFGQPMIVDGRPDPSFIFAVIGRSNLVVDAADLAPPDVLVRMRARLAVAAPSDVLHDVPAGEGDLAGLVTEYELFLHDFENALNSDDGNSALGLLRELVERHARFLRVKHAR